MIQQAVAWLVAFGFGGLMLWLLVRVARSSGHLEADLDAEREAREVEQDMADKQNKHITTDDVIDAARKGKF